MFINSEVRRHAFVVKRRGASRDAPATMGEMRLATKDHIERVEHDGEMNWKKRRLTGDGSPYLGKGRVGKPTSICR